MARRERGGHGRLAAAGGAVNEDESAHAQQRSRRNSRKLLGPTAWIAVKSGSGGYGFPDGISKFRWRPPSVESESRASTQEWFNGLHVPRNFLPVPLACGRRGCSFACSPARSA